MELPFRFFAPLSFEVSGATCQATFREGASVERDDLSVSVVFFARSS